MNASDLVSGFDDLTFPPGGLPQTPSVNSVGGLEKTTTGDDSLSLSSFLPERQALWATGQFSVPQF